MNCGDCLCSNNDLTDYIEHIGLCGGCYNVVIMKIIMFFILCSTKCLTT